MHTLSFKESKKDCRHALQHFIVFMQFKKAECAEVASMSVKKRCNLAVIEN